MLRLQSKLFIFVDDKHRSKIWIITDSFQPSGDLNSLEIMALDVRASGNSALLLLIATVNVARSPEMRYAIGKYKPLSYFEVLMKINARLYERSSFTSPCDVFTLAPSTHLRGGSEQAARDVSGVRARMGGRRGGTAAVPAALAQGHPLHQQVHRHRVE